jgi:hypothetical protein
MNNRFLRLIMISAILAPALSLFGSEGQGVSDGATFGHSHFDAIDVLRAHEEHILKRANTHATQAPTDRNQRRKTQLGIPVTGSSATAKAKPDSDCANDEALNYAASLMQPDDLEPAKQFDSSRPEFRAPNLTRRNVLGGAALAATFVGGTAAAAAKYDNSPSWLKWTIAGISAGALIGGLAGYARALYHPKIASHEKARKEADGFNEFGCAANDVIKGTQAWNEHYRIWGKSKSDNTKPYNSHLQNEVITRAADNNEVVVTPMHIAAGNGSVKVLRDMCETLPRTNITKRFDSDYDSEDSDSDKESNSETESDAGSDSESDEENVNTFLSSKAQREIKATALSKKLWTQRKPTEIDQQSKLKKDTQTISARTAAHWALYSNHTSAAALLLKYGANHTIVDEFGVTAQGLLVKKNNSPLFSADSDLQAEIKKRKDVYSALFPSMRPDLISPMPSPMSSAASSPRAHSSVH